MLKHLLLLYIFSFSPSFAESIFDHETNHCHGALLKKITIMGERCTGTNYVKGLLEENFPSYQILCNSDAKEPHNNVMPHKHFFPWVDLPFFHIRKQGARPRDLYFLKNSDSTLFIYITRNVYDWTRSFYLQPWHVSSKHLLNKDFFHFLSHEWVADEEEFFYTDNWNPYTQKPFANILELRNYKNMNYIQIGLLAPNFLLVQYEKVKEHPEEFALFLEQFFGMEKVEPFRPVTSYKGEKQKKYTTKKYPLLSLKELSFINEHIDWEIENFLGYKKSVSRRNSDG